MKTYKVMLVYNDNNPTGVSHYSSYEKEISEQTFNEIYKLIVHE